MARSDIGAAPKADARSAATPLVVSNADNQRLANEDDLAVTIQPESKSAYCLG
jgi:hypothetical protein